MNLRLVRRTLRLAGLALMGLVLLVALRIVAGKLVGPSVLARAEREFQRDVGSLELADWAPPAPPREQDARLRLLEIARGFPSDLPVQLRGLNTLELGQESEQQIVALRVVVERHRSTLSELRRLAELPGSSIGSTEELYGRHPIAQEPFWNGEVGFLACRLLTAEARVALRDGVISRAIEDLAALRAVTLVFRRIPHLLAAAHARAAELRTLDLARVLLRHGGPEAIRAVGRELDLLDEAPGCQSVFAGEALGARQWIRQLVQEGAFGGGRKGSWIELVFPFTAEHFQAEVLTRYAFAVRSSTIPAPRWPANWTNPPSTGPMLWAYLWPWASMPIVGVTFQTIAFATLDEEQFVVTARRLGRIAAAIALRPPSTEVDTLSPESFAGGSAPLLWSDELPRIERRDRDSWLVSSPEGIRRLGPTSNLRGSRPDNWFETRERLLSWELPAPRPGNARPPLPVEGKTNPNLERQR